MTDDPTVDLDLTTVSEVTGIAHPDLESFLNGDTLPGEAHLEALRRYLGDSADEFLRHQQPRPGYTVASWGRVPNDHQLLDYVSADTLRKGDLIAYRRPRRSGVESTERGGVLCWTRVDRVQVDPRNLGMLGKMMVVTLMESDSDESVVVQIPAVKPIRIARPDHSVPDTSIEEVSIEDLLMDESDQTSSEDDDDDIDLDQLLSED